MLYLNVVNFVVIGVIRAVGSGHTISLILLGELFNLKFIEFNINFIASFPLLQCCILFSVLINPRWYGPYLNFVLLSKYQGFSD